MEQFFVNLFQTHFAALEHFGYLAVGLFALAESVPLIGAIIPGQTIVILGGFMVKLQILKFATLCIVTSIGAALGDIFGFWIGKKYGHHTKFIENKFFIKQEHLENTKQLIARNPIKSIFFGRLHPLTRTFMPFAAGASIVTWPRFITVDILSAIIWAVLSVTIGFLFGRSFEIAAMFIGKFALISSIIAVCIIIAVNYMRKTRMKMDFKDILVFGVCVASLYLFSVIAEDMATGRFAKILDLRLEHIIEVIRTPSLTYIMTFFTTLGDRISMTIITALLILWLMIKRSFSKAGLVAITMIAGFLFADLVRAGFEVVRPTLQLVSASGSSFPSGHALMSMTLATLLSYCVISEIKSRIVRNSLYAAVYLVALCIGFSRLYLNVHWASDVLAGIFGGIFTATLMIVIFRLSTWIIVRSRRRHELPNLQ